MKRTTRVLLILLGGLLGLCLIASTISAVSNRSLLADYRLTGAAPAPPEHLAALDKARLAETLQLKATFGDQIWPGWGRAEIPVILWTSGAEFLTGLPEAPAAEAASGGETWQPAPGDNFLGQPYFRRLSADPQNFAVRVGDSWAGSLATKWESDRFLMTTFRNGLPGPLKAIFPYRALILPSEAQMTGVLHEMFHAYQASVAPARLEAAEAAHRLGARYWAADAAMRAAWAQEMDLLIQALQAKSEGEARTLAGQFLAQRSQRRQATDLPAELSDYERQLEWEEGLAKYVEISAWQQASSTADYQPLPALAEDPYFRGYGTFEQRFGQELSAMQRSARQEGETRLYYTGMAQAMLLDRLAPGWKAHAFGDGAWLEDLLMEQTE